MKRTAIAILLGLFAIWVVAAHYDVETLGHGVERPDTYTDVTLTRQALILKFELGRVVRYSDPYGPAEPLGTTAWARIDLDSAVWTSIEGADLGPGQSSLDLQTAPIRDDLDVFASLIRSGQPIELVHAEPIVVAVESGRPTVAQLSAAAKDVLRAAAAAHRNVALPYNSFGCIALLVIQEDGSARVTLINPPRREYREWWHGPLQAALFPAKFIGVALYILACLLGGGCH